MTPSDRKRIDKLKKLIANCDKGPWYIVKEKNNQFWPDSITDHWVCQQRTLPGNYVVRFDNISPKDKFHSQLLASAITEIPWLINKLERRSGKR